MASTITTGVKKCKPFLLRVMVFSPESGFKFIIEVQKACTSQNEEVWKLIFSLSKRIEGKFVDLVAVDFVSGDTNDITKIAAITDEGMTRAQVRAFRDNVFPLVKPFADTGKEPDDPAQKKIDKAMKAALHA